MRSNRPLAVSLLAVLAVVAFTLLRGGRRPVATPALVPSGLAASHLLARIGLALT